SRAAACAVFPDDIFLDYGERDDTIARRKVSIAVHVKPGCEVVMKLVANDRREVAAVALINAVLAVRVRFVVLNHRVITEREKNSGEPAVVSLAVLNRYEIRIPQINAVALCARAFQSINHPVPDRRAEVLNLDQALMPIRRAERVDDYSAHCLCHQSANTAGGP